MVRAAPPHHLVIDGGPEKARVLLSRVEHELKQADNGSLHIDLLVVTHVDNDHIGGVLELFENFPDGLTIGDVWFNAYRHLLPPDKLGPAQGERLSKALKKLVARSKLSWNQAFDGGPVVIAEQGELPVRKRHDGLKLTLLSPDPAQLAKLAKVWKTVVEEEMRPKKDEEEGAADRLGRKDEWPPDLVKLAKARFQQDTGEANGSSIAFLVEYDGTRVLCTGDARDRNERREALPRRRCTRRPSRRPSTHPARRNHGGGRRGDHAPGARLTELLGLAIGDGLETDIRRRRQRPPA